VGGVYLSGGSGTGKTTFCNKMSAHYGIALITDVIRNIHKKHPYISDLSTNERQLVYATEYIKIHHTSEPTRFISDRSILNVLSFWGLEPEVAHYLGMKNKSPDLLILLPVPSFKWYIDHISYFSDEMRISTYKKRAKLDQEKLERHEIANLFYTQDRDMFDRMKKMCEYLEWRHFIPQIDRNDPDDFQRSWQQQSHDVMKEMWELESVLTQKKQKVWGREVPTEEVQEKLKKLEGGDLDG
jgi:hypothetical protein